MEFVLAAIVRGVLIPAAVFGGWATRGQHSITGIAFGVGFFAGYAALGFAPLVPTDSCHWLAYLPLAVGLLMKLGRWVCLAALLLSGWLLVPTWENFERAPWIGVVALTVLVLGFGLALISRKFPGRLLSVLWLLTFAACAVVLIDSGNAKFAQLAGVAASLLGVCVLITWFGSSPSLMSGVAPGWAVLLAGLLWNGRFGSFSEVPLASYLLVMLAPLASLLMLLPPCKRLSPRVQHTLHFCVVVLPLALAVVLSGIATAADEGEEW
jgi:hypothetical protein